MKITKIVSGGQTGADRGGLDAAIHAGLPHGGWCPKGRWAEDGAIPERYALRETDTDNPAARTEANARDSDATLIFTCGPLHGGSQATAESAAKLRKPVLHIDLDAYPAGGASRDAAPELLARLCAWLDGLAAADDFTLNIAGSRESHAPGLQGRVERIVAGLLRLRGQGTAEYRR